ncbi:FAD binding domain-containing protein [Microsporum canis CBS 113480]|uniref:FAD binding domain-containing protein n=1 Tax=Arthroderma otae (strain ATCC MYA-4605 / CBS 113480) TaxID=554155 RepID=C5FNS0_ARTOC|nr:FAD binding domain-containing protein [Microsporum canis CBS 113480]EEQ31773.1 FAD binding domain-containing protein [Microsporum canis CBS 113480]
MDRPVSAIVAVYDIKPSIAKMDSHARLCRSLSSTYACAGTWFLKPCSKEDETMLRVDVRRISTLSFSSPSRVPKGSNISTVAGASDIRYRESSGVGCFDRIYFYVNIYTMKIAIVGAGISGCAAYLALKKRLPPGEEHEYTLYEAYETSASSSQNYADGEIHSASFVVGAGLAICPNGLACVKRLDEGIYRTIVETGYPYAYQQMKSSHGWNLMRTEASGSEPKINSVSLSRHALWRCFRDRVPDEIVVNKRIAAVVAKLDGRNIIKFADGSPDAEADLVLGADGLKSVTKPALFPEDKEDLYPPHYEGVVGVGGFFPATELHHLMEPGTMNLVFGGNGFFGYCYTTSDKDEPNRHIPQGVLKPGNSVMWWSTYEAKECPDTKSVDKAKVLQDVKTRHASWKSPVVQKILASADIQNMYPVWTVPSLPTWERHGVVLIGDAAHALPPTSGQGSQQAAG